MLKNHLSKICSHWRTCAFPFLDTTGSHCQPGLCWKRWWGRLFISGSNKPPKNKHSHADPRTPPAGSDGRRRLGTTSRSISLRRRVQPLRLHLWPHIWNVWDVMKWFWRVQPIDFKVKKTIPRKKKRNKKHKVIKYFDLRLWPLGPWYDCCRYDSSVSKCFESADDFCERWWVSQPWRKRFLAVTEASWIRICARNNILNLRVCD